MRNCLLRMFMGVLVMLCFSHVATAQIESVDTVYSAVDTMVADDVEDEDYAEEYVVDTMLSDNRIYFSKDSLNAIRNEKEFAYIHVPLDTLLKRRQEKQPPPVQKTKSVDTGISFGDVFRFLIWVIVIGAVLFLIFRLFLSEKGLFAAPASRKKLSTEETEIEDDDSYAKRIADAEKKGAYRLAVRYHYLQVLNTLAAKGWLQLSPDKTNYQYLRELSGKPVRNHFARITLHYDYAWYGNFEVDVNVYQTIKKDVQQLQAAVK
ncbi:MAG: DUF4129 domain-containing protein [Chitinophagaceae bacterium]|nr:DUF4129 domain-containing protein [Chitinophagaceae bacterium]